MKASLKFLVFLLFLLSIGGNHAQPGYSGSAVPLKPQSPKFANDIIINDQPQQNQRNIKICSAFNGWLYAAYSYFNIVEFQDALTILRSEDNGINWSVLFDGPYSYHDSFSKLDILACGHDTNSLKIFLGYSIYDTLTMNSYLMVTSFDKDGVVEYGLIIDQSNQIRDFAMASDDLYPANNSNPFSIAILYSKGTTSEDSIIFCSSSNGGNSFDTRYRVASSSHYLYNVGLTYGRSPSFNSGRYFGVWQDKNNVNSTSGHLYSAHSEPNFNSPFTTPVLIDTLDVTAANNCSNPVISCQNNAADNDSSNLTEVILFNKYIPETHKFTIGGFYNKKATNSSSFKKFTIDPSSNNKIQPDICFNAFDSTFIVTYFDSTAEKLPYYIHDFNMNAADSWTGLISGYNDNNNLVEPHPQVVMDFDKRTGANAWIGLRGNGNGIAMFDSPFNYYVGGVSNKMDKNEINIKVYPNPTSDYTTLEFYLQIEEKVEIKLTNYIGQSIESINAPFCIQGKNRVKINLSEYHSGIYLYMIKAGDSFYCGKIAVNR